MNTIPQTQSKISLHPDTHIGKVALIVSDLEASLDFYTNVLGFGLLRREDNKAVLGAGTRPLLHLTEKEGAQPKSPYTTGLYHFAILVPSRADLARSLRRLAQVEYPLQGASDHLVSEALYLADPDDNGIEIYRDRPRSEWPTLRGQIQMATEPLDFRGILGELERDNTEWNGLRPATRIGHMHLQVADIRQAEEFYHAVLGFDIVVKMPGALFVSAGGYHHHIGLNTWTSRGAPPPSADSAGLEHMTVVLPNATEQARVVKRLEAAGIPTEQRGSAVVVSDPWRNRIVLSVSSGDVAA